MSNANYLAHFGTKGQKHGLRRHQSYETAPTRSGMVGQEVGEAARQSERLNRRDEQDDHNGPRRGPVQYEVKPSYNSPSDLAKASKKQTLKEKLRAKKAEKDAQNVEKNKAKWATNYKDLEKHKDAFTNRELEYALNRLNLTDRIKSDRWEQTRNLTQKGADTMRNLANASKSFVDIYNVVAGGYNTYQNYKSNKANKIDLMPKWNASSGTYNFNNQNNNNQQHKKDNNQKKPKTINARRGRFRGHADHSGMSATEYIAHFGIPDQNKFDHSNMSADDYIAHFGVPGMQWFKRHFQSYKTAPTRSGKVGEEIGLAAKQAERLGEEEVNKSKPPAEHGPFIVMPKDLGDAGFKDTTPAWYKNYDDTKNKRQYSKELDVEMNHNSAGIKKTNAAIHIDSDASQERIDAAVQFAKDFKKHDAAMRDAIANEFFNNTRDVPWLYQKDPDDPPGSLSEKVSNMSLDQQKKFFKEHLGSVCYDPSKTEKQFTTGYIDVSATYGDTTAEVYYSDGGAYWGHVFIVDVDLKTGKIGYISMGG